MKTSEVIRAAKLKISDPDDWIQDDSAEDNMGYSVDPKSAKAVCWCAGGAIDAIATGKYQDCQNYFTRANGCSDIPSFNDKWGRTHTQVLNAMERAALLAESEGQ